MLLLRALGGIVIIQVCWFVRWVIDLLHLLQFLEKPNSDFHEIWHRCSAPLSTLKRSKVKFNAKTASMEIF